LARVTGESKKLLCAAVRALGGCPDRRELELVREALLRGPDDLVAELRRPGLEGFGAIADLVQANGGSAFTLLDLCAADSARRMPEGN
jgi:hypothetical protein